MMFGHQRFNQLLNKDPVTANERGNEEKNIKKK